MIHLQGSFYVFGGNHDSYESTIARLDAITYKWSEAGDMLHARRGHNIIHDGQFIMVIGGYAGSGKKLLTEKCEEWNNQIQCTNQYPELYGYYNYPEVFLLPPNEDYCKHNPTSGAVYFSRSFVLLLTIFQS